MIINTAVRGAAAQEELPPGWSVELVAENLDLPTGIGFTPDGRWMFVTRKHSSDIVAFDLMNNRTQTAPVATVPAFGQPGGETGTFSVTADPDYNNYPYIYVGYTASASSIQISKIHIIENEGAILGDSIETIYTTAQGGTAHNGGVLKFGPDGFLYFVIGDTNLTIAQDLSFPNGKILRMTRDGAPAPGNPFLDTPGADPYIYSYGHRNCFGLAFDPVTLQLWMTEPGPSFPHYDEVNIIKAGKNYGWQFDPFNYITGPQFSPLLEDPVWYGNAPTGGMPTPIGIAFVHSWRYPAEVLGDVFTFWQGNYRLHRMRRAGDNLDAVAFEDKFLNVLPGVAIEMGPDHYLYYSIFFSPSGAIARIKYDESLLAPVTVATRGNLSVGGTAWIFVSSKPQEPIVNYHIPLPDIAVAFVGDLGDSFETPYGTIYLNTPYGAFAPLDVHGVAAMPLEIPNDPSLRGLTTYVQGFRIFGGDAYSTGVSAPPVTITIQ